MMDLIKTQMDLALNYVKSVILDIEDNELQNEQEVINWLDELNKLSVKW